MPLLQDFLQRTPPDLLRVYFDRANVLQPAEISWKSSPKALSKQLLECVDALDDETRQRVIARAERISAMADEVGQTAIFGVVSEECQDQLDGMDNAHARAMWMWLNNLREFERAEEIRFSDAKRYGRMWEAFMPEGPSDGSRGRGHTRL